MKSVRSILAVATILAGVSAYSQSLPEHRMKVVVPFDFTIRHTHMPAGAYILQQSGTVVMMTSDRGRSANVLINQGWLPEPAAHSSLTFKLNEGEYALAQVRVEGSSTELETVVSKRQPKRLEASNGSQTVEVAAFGTR